MKTSFVLVGWMLVASATAARADILWETDYQTARAKAAATGKPLFVDVYTDWCGWCKKLDADVYPDRRVEAASRAFVMLKLNAEGNGAQFARSMNIRSYPTLLFAPLRGGTHTVAGYVEAPTLVAMMNAVAQESGPPRPLFRPSPRARTSSRRRAPLRHSPEVRPAQIQSGDGGVYLMDETGVTPLDPPSPPASKPKSSPHGRAQKLHRAHR